MLLIKAVIMGLIQGLTEFLPVSSTAHLLLAPWLFGWTDDLLQSKSFDISLHFGTLVALVVYFRKDLVDVVRSRDRRLLMLVAAGCLPALLVQPIEKFVDAYSNPDKAAYAPLVMAFFLVFFAFVLLWADRVGRKEVEMGEMSVRDAVAMGFGQTVAAACPGASRSGTTMSFGLLRGMTREAAVRFSFLLSVPTIAAVVLYAGIKNHHEIFSAGVGPVAAGSISSAISGYAAVAFLLSYVRKHGMTVFFWYRLALGALIVLMFFLRR